MALLDMPVISENRAAQALAVFLRASFSFGLDVVTRQFLLFAYAVQAGDAVTAEELAGLAAVSRTQPPKSLLSHTGDVSEICQLLAASCPSVTEHVQLAGYLFSLEGGDGSGKTTQTTRLADALQKNGYKAVATRALGASHAGALKLRELILDPDLVWTPFAEALLSLSIYRESFVRVIVPALRDGSVVVSDRLIDTALVYFRNDAAGVTPAVLQSLYDILVQDIAPHLMPRCTFVLDISYEQAMARRDVRTSGRMDRNEDKGEKFHRHVLDEYRRLAKAGSRLLMVSALAPAEEITAHLYERVIEEIGK